MNLRDYLITPNRPVKESVCNKFKEMMGDNDLILFGAGRGGCRVVEFIRENFPKKISSIKVFADNNPLKENTCFMGKLVLNPEKIFNEYNNELVVICCGEGDVIMNQIMQWGVPQDKIYIPDISVVYEDDACYIQKHIDQLDVVYNQLSDDKSRCVFGNILNYKLNHDMNMIKEIADSYEDQYFDNTLIEYSETDIFFDCGGYTGDTIESYINHCNGKFEKVICLEADPDNAKIIAQKIENRTISKVELIPVAAYNARTKLLFEKMGSGSGSILETEHIESEIIEVQADSIDNILKGERVTYIKMDIEGAEYDAILGACNTIRKYKPTLMISVYHKQDDFITLPLLMLSLNPNYKLYFRHYRTCSVQETVCYAIDASQFTGGGCN